MHHLGRVEQEQETCPLTWKSSERGWWMVRITMRFLRASSARRTTIWFAVMQSRPVVGSSNSMIAAGKEGAGVRVTQRFEPLRLFHPIRSVHGEKHLHASCLSARAQEKGPGLGGLTPSSGAHFRRNPQGSSQTKPHSHTVLWTIGPHPGDPERTGLAAGHHVVLKGCLKTQPHFMTSTFQH